MATSKETYCLCGQPYNVGQFMIECDWCREWFHGSCVDVKIYQSEDIDKYHCPKCALVYGPSIMKVPQNDHRQDRYEANAEELPAQAGSPAWIQALLNRPLPNAPTSASLISLPPQAFTEQYIKENGFNRPILFASSDGLDIRIPPAATFSVQTVLQHCGADLQVEVIDVRRQSSHRMSLKDFVDYYEQPHIKREGKILNVLSLEFSDTPMSKLVWAPYMARSLDWVRRCWPRPGDSEDGDFDGLLKDSHLLGIDPKSQGDSKSRLNVQKYCLMSTAGSYTDFHVDFGGTTVWYHILKGRKIFYLVPPTATNLALYQQWNTSTTQNQCFFGDLVDWYTISELKPGQTMFIPTGWIHAVFTPEDSLVFGGNFLHSYGIELQLQINEIESRIETPSMFRYPLFETMHWYAGVHLLQIVKRVNEDTQDEDFTLKEDGGNLTSTAVNNLIAAELPPHLLRGIRILAAALKEWNSLKSTDEFKRNNIPSDINSGQLVRDLTRELRRLQRLRPTPRPSPRPAPAQIARNPLVQKLNHNRAPKLHPEDVNKKLVKLTLPRPIMQTQLPDAGILTKSTPYTSSGYDSQGSQDSYESSPYVANSQTAFEMQHDSLPMADIVKKGDSASVLRIKFGNLSGTQLVQPMDANYNLQLQHHDNSILKNHLISKAKPSNQWTISKKECEDEQTVLFTNESNTVSKAKDVMIPNQAAILSGQGPDAYGAYVDERKTLILPEYSTVVYGQPQHKLEPIVYSPDSSPYMPEEKIDHAHNRPTYGTNGSFQLDSKNDLNQSAMLYSYSKARFKNDENSYGGSLKIEPCLPEYQQNVYGVVDDISEPLRLAPGFQTSTPVAAPQPDRRRSSRAPRRRPLSPSYHYDATDGDLCIDEDRPARRRNKPAIPNAKKSSLKMRIPAHLYKQSDQSEYVNTHRQLPPANGIESLLQASALAAESAEQECEAVEGMLSISQYQPQYSENVQRSSVLGPIKQEPSTPPSYPKASFGLATVSSPIKNERTPRRPVQISRTDSPEVLDPDEEAHAIKEVHRDEEFVYPSLELSSDDEEYQGSGSGSRNRNRLGHDRISKHEKDESWSPRARLGRLLPKMNRPARPGVRREAVRKALQAAAVTNTSPPAPSPHIHNTVNHIQVKKPVKKKPLPRPVEPTTPPAIITSPGGSNNKLKNKKGMKTAKQRLGKILKLHKMIY